MPFRGKHILVTGGTGSLGRTLVRRLLTGEMGRPSRITVFSRDEAKQYQMKAEWMRRSKATDDILYRDVGELLDFQIGDIRDFDSVSRVVRRADVVFNTAALKQVPTCEYFPIEAVRTNVLGADNLARAVLQRDSRVTLVVGISTDKACKPINAMGMTKALQERVFIEANLGSDRAQFVCVRYGNVIASRGSVVPLFLEQIRHGGPVTITLKEMTRFLLTLDKAVDTIFAAARLGRPGETFVPQVPSARVVDIARALIGDRPVSTEYSGIRPGEKIHEILVSDEESFRTVERDDYFVICPMLPELRPAEVVERVLYGEYSSSHHVMELEPLRTLLTGMQEVSTLLPVEATL